MASVTVELTAEQIVDAFRQLSSRDHRYVIWRLLSELGDIPQGEHALKRFDELRDLFRMDTTKERRHSALLAKSSEGRLAKTEQQ